MYGIFYLQKLDPLLKTTQLIPYSKAPLDPKKRW